MLGEKLIGSLFGSRTGNAYEALMKAYDEQGKFSGTALVAHKGEVVFRKAYGLANREHDAATTPETVFRIGSMTKSFTAVAIMQLAEAGRLSIDAPLNQFVPDYAQGKSITLRHLLSNTSGIPDYILTPEYETVKKRHLTTQELMELFWDKPLLFAPGAGFHYSNSGWVLLGYVLEVVTGKPYEQVIKEQIFAPSGMMHSGYAWEQPFIKNRALGYADTGAGVLNAEYIDETTMHAAGGLYSTIDDLLNFDQALHDGKLLKPATLAQMGEVVAKEGYGLGWELYKLYERRVVAHSGGLPGYVSNLARFPDDNLTIILLSNLGSAATPQITEALAAIALGEPYQLPTAYTFIDLDPALLADYAGNYSVTFFGRTSILNFAVESGKLTMDVKGLPKTIANAISENRFYARSKGDIDMQFLRDTGGRVDRIAMNWAGHEQTATRVE